MQTINNKQNKQYDLEDRTFKFAKEIRIFVKSLPYSIANKEDCKQLVRSSGSIGANYIEANESLSKKDFVMRIKISKKETKESKYWLRLLNADIKFIRECDELIKIFGAIIEKSK